MFSSYLDLHRLLENPGMSLTESIMIYVKCVCQIDSGLLFGHIIHFCTSVCVQSDFKHQGLRSLVAIVIWDGPILVKNVFKISDH